MHSITVFIRAYNSEETLEACIRNVLGFADEILLFYEIDSEDSTKEIIDYFVNDSSIRSYDTKFNGSYSDLNNLVFKHATHNWIMMLDSDELIHRHDLARLRKFLQNNNSKNSYMLPRYNFVDMTHRISGKYYYPDFQHRIYTREVRYRSNIHEMPYNIETNKIVRSIPLGYHIYHYSELKSPKNIKNKLDRYSKMYEELNYHIPTKEDNVKTIVEFHGKHPSDVRFMKLYS